jgi:hypothetical protein
MKRNTFLIIFICITIYLVGCSNISGNDSKIKTDENGYAILSDSEIENIVKRSYQYVAMYNVNQKMAFAEKGFTTGGYNKGLKNVNLLDHTARFISRPNNDVLYQLAMLDLRKEPVVFVLPAIDSKYVSMMVTGYDHYVNIPMSTVDGDFHKPKTILFYTERTENFNGEKPDGVDEIFEMTGDFVSLILRVMPHANEPERFKHIVSQIHEIKGMTLSEFLGKPKPEPNKANFPPYGKTDADVFGNNLLEVMQFVFNHTTFDTGFILDREILKAYEPLGIIPGRDYNPKFAAKIKGEKFKEISLKVKDEEIAKFNDPVFSKQISKELFQPKGTVDDLEALLLPSVVGPIGQPEKEAIYLPVPTNDGSPMNALHDYVVTMSKDELPPAKAFWSATLYDAPKGFFIPNKYKKYSVGENAGMKLNKDGGIDIYIAAVKPEGVPQENWLPINREDLELALMLRVYAPDLEKMKTWEAPKAIRIGK